MAAMQVRLQIIRAARIKTVYKFESCMVDKEMAAMQHTLAHWHTGLSDIFIYYGHGFTLQLQVRVQIIGHARNNM